MVPTAAKNPDPNLQLSIAYGDRSIPFTLIRRKRRTLAIQINPDQTVRVLAPQRATQKRILAFILAKAAWIIRKQREFEAQPPPAPPLQYVAGELHAYLGREYQLHIDHATPANVQSNGDLLCVSTGGKSGNQAIEGLVQGWFREQAKLVLTERVDECLAEFEKHNISRPALKFRNMKTRWGSCSPKGRITFNTQLIHVPPGYIDYVVYHELCHLKQPNHGKAFYELLAAMLPDWQARRQQLNSYALI